jgi:hypothetical protein
VTEDVAADLVHDRDISEIITSSLSERLRGRSSADTEAIGAGIGGFIGPVLFGFGGGASSAGSTASQSASRNVAGTTLNQARDRTLQSASAVRSQRTSVVQTARQGESLRVQTEVVANYNHCHAVTVEYFEVLRHFQVSQELAHVQECLFIPFELTMFTAEKAARWREPLARFLRRPDLRGGFDALDRVRTNWADADFPLQRYADESIEYLDGELWIAFDLPRPRDTADHQYDAAQWAPYAAYLSQPTADVWQTYMGVALPADRDRVWNRQLAPRIAARLVDAIRVTLKLDGGSSQTILNLDATLVSSFSQSQQLLVSLRPDLTGPGVVRARVSSVVVSMAAALPASAKVVVWSGSMRYRTAHLSFSLFADYRIHNDIGLADSVEIPTPLYYPEKRNPRAEDRRLADTLVEHLNEHVEYYHQAIWRTMDPNRRYLLLDGFLAPNSGGKSVASVVENRLIGIIGNCLVMPVVPGVRLDPSYADSEEPVPLTHLYATEPPPPMRISVPTHGVFAEALMGACNSCEVKDDTRFWRWEESPIPDDPTGILPVKTCSRATTPPSLAPDEFPAPLVQFQNVPRSPNPTGLAAALNLIGTPNLFRDLTGLDLNQQNAAAAFQGALSTAQFFGGEAAKLAQQQFHNRSLDRTVKRIGDAKKSGMITDDQARRLTESAFRGSIGEGRPAEKPPTASPAVRRVIDRVAESRSGELHVNRPGGSVSVRTGEPAQGERLDFAVDPPVIPKAQPSNMTCWAAAGAMLLSWRDRVDLTVQSAADRAGAGWRQKLDANQGLSAGEIRAYTRAIGLVSEPLMCYLPRGIARLLRAHGPLWVVGDDAIEANQISHVRIVTGITGDGSAESTRIRFIDPATGSNSEESYIDFTRRMEAADPVATGLGVYHF